MERCLHNKKGLDPGPEAYIRLPNEGNCHECTFDPENNKNCRKYHPVTLVTFCIERGPTPMVFTSDSEGWKKELKDIFNPRSSVEGEQRTSNP